MSLACINVEASSQEDECRLKEAFGNTRRTSTIMSAEEVIVRYDELHEKMNRIGGKESFRVCGS